MATNILTKNNARSTLLAGITAGQTNLSVQSGHGTRFSAPVTGEIVKLTLYDTAGNIEICHGITRSGDGWSTIVRAQEGTAARAWNAGDGISENATAGFLGGLSQLDREETATAKKTFGAPTSFTLGLGPSYINNIGYTASVASKALTVARKTQLLADPTASTPIEIAFHNRTETVGDSVIRQITTAHSIVVPSGATGGFAPILNTVTMTIASPCVVTDNSHNRSEGDTVIFTTTGALPTGITASAVHYIRNPTANSYNVSTTPTGALINTSGSQSGVHTASYAEKGSFYIYECDNGTIRETGLAKLAIFDESKLHNTTAISTGADSDNVLYTTTAMTNAAVRLTGRVDITTGAVAGEWDNEDTRIALETPGVQHGTQIISEFSSSSSNSLTPLPSPSSGTPVNVEVGDLIMLTLSTNCARNSADFAVSVRFPPSGTMRLELGDTFNPDTFIFTIIGHAAYGAGAISNCQTIIRRVAKAGTFTGFSGPSAAYYGSTPINLSSQLSVMVMRANR